MPELGFVGFRLGFANPRFELRQLMGVTMFHRSKQEGDVDWHRQNPKFTSKVYQTKNKSI